MSVSQPWCINTWRRLGQDYYSVVCGLLTSVHFVGKTRILVSFKSWCCAITLTLNPLVNIGINPLIVAQITPLNQAQRKKKCCLVQIRATTVGGALEPFATPAMFPILVLLQLFCPHVGSAVLNFLAATTFWVTKYLQFV